MISSLVHALNAIEHTPDGTDVAPLLAFCAANGLDNKAVEQLVKTPGPTDKGRVTRVLQAAAAPKPEAKKKTSKKKVSKKK